MKYVIFGTNMKTRFNEDVLENLPQPHIAGINFSNITNLNNCLELNYVPLKHKAKCDSCANEITNPAFIVMVGKNETCYLEDKLWCIRNLGSQCITPDEPGGSYLIKFKKLMFIYSQVMDCLPNIKSNWKQIFCFGNEGIVLTALTEVVA